MLLYCIDFLICLLFNGISTFLAYLIPKLGKDSLGTI